MDRNSRESDSRKAERLTSVEELKSFFQFNLEAGEIYGPRGGRADKIQYFRGRNYTKGPPRYLQIQKSIGGKVYKFSAHRAIWAVANGRWPREGFAIDHLNSNTHDNRISNLQEITISENARLSSVRSPRGRR